MARSWLGSGVIPGYNNQCQPRLGGSVATVDTGGVWIDGFYGENSATKNISVAGGDGMLVARADPTARQVMFAYNLGTTPPTQTQTGIYEIPIARVTSGAMVDIRQYASGGPIIPAGVMMDFAGGTAPAGWLLCDGTLYLRTDYPRLAAVLGTTWGGDAAHFNVPNMQGRVGVGTGTAVGQPTNRILAATGGEENHQISVAEMPGHDHNSWTYGDDRDHIHGNIHSPGADQNHPWPLTYVSAAGLGLIATGPANEKATADSAFVTGGRSTGHLHQIPGQGGWGSHNNVQPFAVVTKVIKA
jgi:microcystin-dependent protein